MAPHHYLLVTAMTLVGVAVGASSVCQQPSGPVAKDNNTKVPAPARVVLTEAASKQILRLMKDNPETKYLRVRATQRGDFKDFKLDLDTTAISEKDFRGEFAGIPVIVDKASATFLPYGTIIDYRDQEQRTGFYFTPPVFDRQSVDQSRNLAEARKGFKTTLRPWKPKIEKSPAPVPPPDLFRVIRYDAAHGKMTAYLSPDPGDGKKHPAIVWITGGDCNSLDAGCWRDGGIGNEQSASAFRKAGMVMMFPSLRGGNDNPGDKEGFLGEVDDVSAAADYLKGQPYVDPNRIYLGGHSTGGTLALLTAEVTSRFRAVFSFGPTDDVFSYGPEINPFSVSDPLELQLRSPIRWLHSIRTPVFVIEGSRGNADAVRAMAAATTNDKVHFFIITGANHFNVLAPVNSIIANRVQRDIGPTCNLSFSVEELSKW